MQKVISILGESFNRYDIEGDPFPGFTRYNFDNYPSWYTYQTFIMLQSEMFVEEWREKPKDIKPCLGHFAKTKIIAQGFEHIPALGYIDNTIDDKYRGEAETYMRAHEFVVDFPNNDYQHLIVHTDYGHACVLPNVNGETHFRMRSEWGLPKKLSKTFQRWTDVTTTNLLKFINYDNTIVMIHNDHGTMRNNKKGKRNLFDGFLFIRSPMPLKPWTREVTWADIRMTLATVFGIKKEMRLIEGESLVDYSCGIKFG